MKITRYIIIGLTTLALASCNDWFDVTSSNEIREKDHFAIDQGFAQSVRDVTSRWARMLYMDNMFPTDSRRLP